jgi:RNA polymerase sigma-70 factor (ECF subfamily)
MDLDLESVLVEKAKEGNEEAWRVLFKWNFTPVYSFCLQLANGHDNDAEDIAQQAFVIAARKIARFNGHKGTFRQWLFGIAKNCHRKLASKKKTTVLCSESQIPDVSVGLVENFSENRRVLETLAQLSSHHRGILEAKYMSRKSMAQLAEDHGVTQNAIGLRLARARDKFKQHYQLLLKQENDI